MAKKKDNFGKETNITYIEEGREKNFFNWNNHKITEGIVTILESPCDAYQKKINLFNFLKDLEVVRLEESGEEKRFNCLLEGKLYNEVSKQKMKEYKKLTVKEFSKVE